MSKPISNHATPLSIRVLCILMASLTACSTGRSQYVWHDVTDAKTGGAVRAPRQPENWGVKPEGVNVTDPEIAPGYLLSMRSPADSKLNGDYRVDFDGNLQLPYDVTVNTNGLTLFELKKKLPDLYRSYFKSPSDIDLRVKERRFWLDVRGLVEKPGRVLVEPDASLDQVIGLVGGTSKTAPPQYVRIQKGQQMFVFDLNQYYNRGEDHPQILGWLGGEIVFFQKEMSGSMGDRAMASSYRLPVYMLGEVRKPGEYTFIPGSDFVDSLIQAGGFTERADLDNIEVIRRAGKRTRVFDFSWQDFQQAPPPLQGDVILVHADTTTKSERRTFLAVAIISAVASLITAAVLVASYNRGRI